MRLQTTLVASLVAIATGLPAHSAFSSELAPEGRALLLDHPGLNVHQDGVRTAFYGRRMGSGETPEAAVEAWLLRHAGAFGVAEVELVLEWQSLLRFGELSVFAYSQTLDGLPVEHSQARILARNATAERGDESHVIYAAALLCKAPVDGLGPDLVGAEDALLEVQRDPDHVLLERWTEPTLVVLPPHHDNSLAGPIRAWKFMGENPDRQAYQAYTFFVDSTTGVLAHVRNEVHDVDVAGEITGNVTPGTLPDTPGNPPVTAPVQGAPARIAGDPTAFADANGDYVISHGGSGPVTVSTNLVGQWVTVLNDQGGELSLSQSVTPPGPADFFYNPSPAEFTTSQLNGFTLTTAVHDFFRDRAPTFTGLDMNIDCHVNVSGSCNAFFSGSDLSINFFTAGGGCVNMAFSTIVYHEYGHFIVNRLGLGQGAFGEGYGDTIGGLAYNTPLSGEGVFGVGTVGRDTETANVQYPCSGEIHFCGQLLSGCWWDLEQALEQTEPQGEEIANQLFVDWSQITLGGQGDSSAHPLTAIEVLMVDDDDGDLGNGTPHRAEICQGFADHSIDCPALPEILFLFPDGTPDVALPDSETPFLVDVMPNTEDAVPGSGRLHYSIDGGPFVDVPMTVLGPDEYQALLPATSCGSFIAFYVSADHTGGGTVTSPSDAPASNYTAAVTTGGVVVSFSDDLESDLGWTVGDLGDNATTGIWERVDPVGTAAQPEDDHTPAPDTICWVTGQQPPGGDLGTNDVDGGKTTLLTPSLDLIGSGGARIGYWRWFSNDTGAGAGSDVFVVDISDQGGSSGTWTNVEIVGPSGPEASGGWFYHEFIVTDFITPSADVKLRFVAQDQGTGSLVEAAIDDLQITELECASGGPDFERGDCNQDGVQDISDPIRLLNTLFGAGNPFGCDDACDANDDGALGLPDALVLLDAIFQGVPLPAPYPLCGSDGTDDGLTCDSPTGCP